HIRSRRAALTSPGVRVACGDAAGFGLVRFRSTRCPAASAALRSSRSTCRAALWLYTTASSREFDARRLAPCTPVHATSPAAYRPGSDVRPAESVITPPQL